MNQSIQLQISPMTSQLVRVSENQKEHDNQIQRLMDAINETEKMSQQSGLADVQSKTDRAQLNDRVHEIEHGLSENMAERKAQVAALAERGIETETQFRAEDRIRNIQFAEQQRWNAILWGKAYPGVPYPAIQYFPEMAQSSLQSLAK